MLDTEKMTLEIYLNAIKEGSTKNLRSNFIKNFESTTNDQYLLFKIMQEKGFYDIQPANNLDIEKIAKLIKSRIEILSDIEEKTAFLVEVKPFDETLYQNKKQKTDEVLASAVLPKVLEVLGGIDDFTNDNLFATLSGLSEKLEIKSRQLFYVLRIALTGLEVTPGGATEILEILQKEESIKRIKSAIENL